jgi:hypothetical protein
MSQEQRPIHIAIGKDLWTRALVAGSGEVTVEEPFPLAGRQ